MKVKGPKKIRTEDFSQEDRELIGKMSDIVTDFQDDMYALTLNNIDYDNLNRQVAVVTVNINGIGQVINTPQIKTTLKGSKVLGIVCIRAENQINPTTYPTTSPFVSWQINGNLITILNITGLQVNSQYKLTLEIM